jgi:hypothetical protein
MRTINKIITPMDCSRGAPMGRTSIGTRPKDKRVFDCFVLMCSCCGAYDTGGAYWGLGVPLRVAYTKDLSYIEFYRGHSRKKR